MNGPEVGIDQLTRGVRYFFTNYRSIYDEGVFVRMDGAVAVFNHVVGEQDANKELRCPVRDCNFYEVVPAGQQDGGRRRRRKVDTRRRRRVGTAKVYLKRR